MESVQPNSNSLVGLSVEALENMQRLLADDLQVVDASNSDMNISEEGKNIIAQKRVRLTMIQAEIARKKGQIH